MLCYPGDGLPALPALPAHLAPPRPDDRADGGHRLLHQLALLPLVSLVRLRLAGGRLLLLLPVQAKDQDGTYVTTNCSCVTDVYNDYLMK